MSLRSKFKYSLNTFNFSGAVKQSGQIPNLIKLNRNINRLFLHNKRFVKRGLYKRSGFVNIYKKLSSSNVIHKFTFDRYTALPFQKVQTKWTKWAAMFMNLYIRRRSVRIGIRRFEPLSRYQLRYLGNFCATAVGLQYHNSF